MAETFRKHLIVGRYNENIDWTYDFDDWAVHVVTNGQDRPNIGREPGMFLWWIVKNYSKLKDDSLYAFVQGDPFPHCKDLAERLGSDINGFLALGNTIVTSDSEGKPHHPGLPVKECFEKWIGKEFPGEVEFTAGGQFVVSGEAIKLRNKQFYEDLEAEMSEGEKPWVLERLWKYVLAR